ncbi:ABC transporter permease [Hyunsoonleella pacifica]|uniref:ABC transporter permease n=1 Tax=Hyunsoonleella pacifica TaxID=1080224 RepID=A0A4Q9FKN9_9FLAO|nr:FtsX-like permease family protein [Hyunsoonleella pacifica]TBN13936.1 ABC transporter permease [Hyunsoonleella pacifica]GGD26949.1 permease [Hyunsoonleella pacifica]
MNYEYFIAKRIIGGKAYKSSISAPIIKIGIAAIAIGMLVMMIAIATGIGLQEKIREKVVAFNGHATITNYDSNISQESIVPISKTQEFYPEFKAVEGITHIQAVATKFGVIRTEIDFEGAVLKGVGSDYNWQYFKAFLVEGCIPSFEKKWSEEVLISEYLVKRLGLRLGDKFQMHFLKDDTEKPPNIITFEIVGIYNSRFQDFDETYLIGNLRHIQRINKWKEDEIGNFEVFIEDYNDIERMGVEIFQNTPSTLNTSTINEKFYSIIEWVKIFDKNIYGIIGIMILVAGINMITALLVLILERTQMIGILKALGSSNWSIRKVFLYNASYLIVLGLFWGNVLGVSILLAQKYFKVLEMNPDVYYVTEAPVYINWSYILGLNIGTLLLCLLMLLVPSYIITKISPVKAIRFE